MSTKFLLRTATGVAAASAAILLATPGLASASTASPEHGDSGHGGSKYLKVVCLDGGRPMELGRDSGGGDGWAEPRGDRKDAKGSDENDGHYNSEKQYKKDGKNVLVQKTTIITCGDVAVSQSAAQNHSASASAAGSISLCADRAPALRVTICSERNSGGVTTPQGSVAGGDGGASGTNSGLAAGGSGALAAAAALGTVLLRRRSAAAAA